jgi:hypothetical protein
VSVPFVLGLSESAWTGLLTITPVVLVTALLLWIFMAVHSSTEK